MLSFEVIVVILIIFILYLISNKSLNNSIVEQFIRWDPKCNKIRNPFTGRTTYLGCIKR